ncbi:hypothetical protein [Lysinibacillus capsici]|uniref:hypothetical protein n=1 Tax=Lysinibacillus capsici TaxID=2115968 RepID=UPI000E20AA8D|nr:hypothetical protein [Lysinibacillus capsici]RDV27125.1 hypothetical protein C7B89_20030 [Lysinibacillus capsici]
MRIKDNLIEADENFEYEQRSNRITKEFNRIKGVLKEASPEKVKSNEGLIKRCAFIRINLEDMEEDLLKNGFVEMFTQSEKTPPYERERPVVRQYVQLVKQYQVICKQLSDLLGTAQVNGVIDDGFESFVNDK